MSRAPFCAVLSLLASVGCSSPPPPVAPPAPIAEAPAPRCKASEPNQPVDLREVMKKGGSSVKGCFLLGKATSSPDTVKVSMKIAPAGGVKSVSSKAAGSEAVQTTCAEDVLRKLSFGQFCGDEVEIAWTYSLQGG